MESLAASADAHSYLTSLSALCQKAALDDAMRTIANQSDASESKVGDLAGVHIYKFRMGTLVCLLAYRLLDENTLKLLMVGPHENFYRDLKRTEH